MVGFGYDLHRLEEGRRLVVGSIEIDSPIGVVAHSDGDVVIHSLVDAILGAIGAGDIGEHFPDTDPQYKNKNSRFFLEKALELLEKANCKLINIDITIVLQSPKLSLYKNAIKNSLAELCNIDAKRVNVKAKTNEKLGYLGRSEGIASYSICQVEEK